ncbi:MAG: SpoIIE family protein phosphatase [Vicinamibacteria bacterium]
MASTQLTSGSARPLLSRQPFRFLFRTRLGKVFLALVVLRILRPLGLLPPFVDGVVDLGLAVYVAGFLVRGVLALRSKLLWRIRRKLIISYLLIGMVPTVLILFFFLLSAYLVFGQVSSYILSASLEKTEAEAAQAADLAVADLLSTTQGEPSTAEIEHILRECLSSMSPNYPGVSAAYVGGPGSDRRVVVDQMPDLLPPGETLPDWASQGYQGLLQVGNQYLVAGFSKPPKDGAAFRVLVTIPLGSALRHIEQETGLEAQQVLSAVSDESGGVQVETGSARSDLSVLASPSGDSPYFLRWAALVEARQWAPQDDVQTDPEPLGIILIRFSLLNIYRVIATNALELGRAILVLLGILAGLFLAIEVLAIFVGLLLARSITGSIHALSKGTEHVRQGNFSYKVQVRSRDQLGELAESFNLMTTSIQDLLRQSAEKERLEEELRIARQIQMSLLPKDTVKIPGLTIAALCLPATEVGGDYYDFISLDDRRMALLIADVSGKGTSAALYMAELKGLVLSLSQIYDSPRQLLVEANKLLAATLDSRSFITMAYAVIDMDEKKMTYARAGHNPILQLTHDGNGTRVLAPEGLGLALDRGTRFEEILAEESVALRSGDLFLFFTDGLSEAMNPQADLFGESRLREIMERHSGLAPEDLRERIIDEVFAFTEGEDQHDDMTMVLVRVS